MSSSSHGCQLCIHDRTVCGFCNPDTAAQDYAIAFTRLNLTPVPGVKKGRAWCAEQAGIGVSSHDDGITFTKQNMDWLVLNGHIEPGRSLIHEDGSYKWATAPETDLDATIRDLVSQYTSIVNIWRSKDVSSLSLETREDLSTCFRTLLIHIENRYRQLVRQRSTIREEVVIPA